jgi:ATP-binding cassette subfamily F protein 3
MRVMLAKLLLAKPSVLLLDEPTNHLDLPSIQWVEKYIANYENAVVVVSHDRQFLDNVSTTTVEVANNKLNYYPLRRADPICQRLSLRESWQSRRL